MTLFLACLKDFAKFAKSKDQKDNIPPEKCFKLPYNSSSLFRKEERTKLSLLCVHNIFWCISRIDNDKVKNYSITQSFNKQENWTKALKYTLCNLK
ncbi:hypothetical protein AAHE18_11G053800 [Arachis hypogaea]